jgi:hypothetical protein
VVEATWWSRVGRDDVAVKEIKNKKRRARGGSAGATP